MGEPVRAFPRVLFSSLNTSVIRHRNTEQHAVYLGTSSNWSFTRRLLTMTHEYVHQTTVPTTALLFDGAAYDLNWNDRRTAADLDTPSLPTLDYAIYLINAVKFHCGQMFHLFDEASFMDSLYDFYSDPTHRIAEADLWYIHFLIILAFGKAFTTQRNQGKKPPGSDFFVKAVQLLPNTIVLERRPLISTEIICCISLYLQCLDYRDAAHIYVRLPSSSNRARLTGNADRTSNENGTLLWHAH